MAIKINRKAPFQKQLIDMSNAISYLDDKVDENVADINDELDNLNEELTEELGKKVSKDDFGYIYLNTGTSGTLTDEQYAECLKEYCVIDYQANENMITRYYKLSESYYPVTSTGTISFNRCWFGSTESRTDSQGRDYRRVQQFVISVNRATKAYTVSTEGVYDIYNKSNIDTLLANLPLEGVGTVDLGTTTQPEGTFTAEQLTTLTSNVASIIIKNGVYYYRADSNSTYIFYRSIPSMTFDVTTYTYVQREFRVNKTSGA